MLVLGAMRGVTQPLAAAAAMVVVVVVVPWGVAVDSQPWTVLITAIAIVLLQQHQQWQ
jgi:hypothetical protein